MRARRPVFLTRVVVRRVNSVRCARSLARTQPCRHRGRHSLDQCVVWRRTSSCFVARTFGPHVVGADGIVLAAEKKTVSPLLEPVRPPSSIGRLLADSRARRQIASSDKMYKIDEHVAAAVAGITSDANILVNNARVTGSFLRRQ